MRLDPYAVFMFVIFSITLKTIYFCVLFFLFGVLYGNLGLIKIAYALYNLET